jgi:hypothetical protein
MVRKSDFLAIGGFDSPYWPGEDTKLCLDLIKITGKTIMYVPEMQVWHHRRAGLGAHLRQVGGYGLHRGYFAKRYPETSRRLPYFIPTCFLVFFVSNALIPFLNTPLLIAVYAIWVCYVVVMYAVWRDIRKYETMAVTGVAVIYVMLTHLCYGGRFAQGLLTTNLRSRLR